MRTATKLFIVILLTGTLFIANPRARQNNDGATCGVIEQALRAYREVKVGATRRDVAKYFVPDGGMQFPAKTRYVYPKCNYLHIEVEFELVRPADISSLPNDRVIGVSKLYVDNPAKD